MNQSQGRRLRGIDRLERQREEAAAHLSAKYGNPRWALENYADLLSDEDRELAQARLEGEDATEEPTPMSLEEAVRHLAP